MADKLLAPIELTDSELDHVAAGQLQSGLINVFANDVLSHNNVCRLLFRSMLRSLQAF